MRSDPVKGAPTPTRAADGRPGGVIDLPNPRRRFGRLQAAVGVAYVLGMGWYGVVSDRGNAPWVAACLVGTALLLGYVVRGYRLEPGSAAPVLVERRWCWPRRRMPLDARTKVATTTRWGQQWLTLGRGGPRMNVLLAGSSSGGEIYANQLGVASTPTVDLMRDPTQIDTLADAVRGCQGGTAVQAELHQLADAVRSRREPSSGRPSPRRL